MAVNSSLKQNNRPRYSANPIVSALKSNQLPFLPCLLRGWSSSGSGKKSSPVIDKRGSFLSPRKRIWQHANLRPSAFSSNVNRKASILTQSTVRQFQTAKWHLMTITLFPIMPWCQRKKVSLRLAAVAFTKNVFIVFQPQVLQLHMRTVKHVQKNRSIHAALLVLNSLGHIFDGAPQWPNG